MNWETDVKPIVTSFIRHGLTLAAGALGTAGALQPDQQTQFIAIGTSLLLYGASQVWAVLQKRKQAAAIQNIKDRSSEAMVNQKAIRP